MPAGSMRVAGVQAQGLARLADDGTFDPGPRVVDDGLDRVDHLGATAARYGAGDDAAGGLDQLLQLGQVLGLGATDADADDLGWVDSQSAGRDLFGGVAGGRLRVERGGVGHHDHPLVDPGAPGQIQRGHNAGVHGLWEVAAVTKIECVDRVGDGCAVEGEAADHLGGVVGVVAGAVGEVAVGHDRGPPDTDTESRELSSVTDRAFTSLMSSSIEPVESMTKTRSRGRRSPPIGSAGGTAGRSPNASAAHSVWPVLFGWYHRSRSPSRVDLRGDEPAGRVRLG